MSEEKSEKNANALGVIGILAVYTGLAAVGAWLRFGRYDAAKEEEAREDAAKEEEEEELTLLMRPVSRVHPPRVVVEPRWRFSRGCVESSPWSMPRLIVTTSLTADDSRVISVFDSTVNLLKTVEGCEHSFAKRLLTLHVNDCQTLLAAGELKATNAAENS